jgi:hypothetical protein
VSSSTGKPVVLVPGLGPTRGSIRYFRRECMLELHTVTTLSIHVPGVDISSRSLAPSILIARTIIGGGSGCDQAAGGGCAAASTDDGGRSRRSVL